MPDPSPEQTAERPAQPGDAWRAAEAAGVDMSLLEHSLSLTVWERMVEHEHALELADMLQNAKIKPSCQT
jgi:hypothetical protein